MVEDLELLRLREKALAKRRARAVDPSVLARPSSVPAHLRYESPIVPVAAQAFGVPPDAVSLESQLGPLRAGAGAAANTPEEELSFYQQYGPQARYRLLTHPETKQRYVAGRTPEGQVFFPNPPGFEMGDITQFVGAEGAPVTAAGATAAVSPPPWSLVTAPLAYGATKAAQELAQIPLGTQAEPFGQAAQRIGVETGIELGAGGLGSAAQKVFQLQKGLLFPQTPPSMVRDVEAIEAGRQQGMGLSPLRPWQLMDSPVFHSAAKQQEGISGGREARLGLQREELIRQDLPRLQAAEAPAVKRSLVQEAERRAQEIYDYLPTMRDYERAGININKAFKDFYSRSNAEVKAGYRAVDQAQAAERPIFDIANAQQQIDSLGIFGVGKEVEEIKSALVDVSGRPITVSEVNKLVNVASPEGKVRRSLALLSQLDPQQTDYRVIQRLRTIVGGAIKTWKSGSDQNMTSEQADMVWHWYTDVLRNPVNREATPEYIRTFDEATAKAKEQFMFLRNEKVKSALRREHTPYRIFNELAGNPSLLDRQARELIDRYSPARASQVKTDLLGDMVHRGKGGLVDKLVEFRRRDEAMLDWMTGSPYQSELLLKQAQSADGFRNSVWRPIYEQKSADFNARRALLLESVTDRKSAAQFMRSVTPNNRPAIRQTVGDFLLDGVIGRDPKTGLGTIDLPRYLKRLQEAEKAGWWNHLLTSEDRTRFKAFEAYARRTAAGEDAGAGIQLGEAASATKEPSRWLNLIHDFWGSKTLGWFLASDKIGNKVYENILKRQTASGTRGGQIMGLVLGSGIQYTADLETEALLEEYKQEQDQDAN